MQKSFPQLSESRLPYNTTEDSPTCLGIESFPLECALTQVFLTCLLQYMHRVPTGPQEAFGAEGKTVLTEAPVLFWALSLLSIDMRCDQEMLQSNSHHQVFLKVAKIHSSVILFCSPLPV